MSKIITKAKIWLPNDDYTIRVQNMSFKNMDKVINQVSKKLGATVRITSFVPLAGDNRYVLYSDNKKRKTQSYNQRTLPILYEEYSNEHPIIKTLIESFYNGRISYYKLCEYLVKFPDVKISDLMPYYTSFTFEDYSIASISSIQKSMKEDINETAHGYNPAETLVLREYRQELAQRGEWMPSYGGIKEEVAANDFILKRVFKRKM